MTGRLDRDIGWFRDEHGLGVLVTQTRDGCVLAFPVRPGAVNEYLGTVPHEALRKLVDAPGWNWRERGSYEQLRDRIKAGPLREEW